MSDWVIRVESLSKRYRIGEQRQAPYATLRESLARAFRPQWRSERAARHGAAGGPRHMWALRDVSFHVEQSEVVGIIGQNGAGKSTLLKVLSRITAPTEGRAEIRGRIGSLLEVGTGFHPELTGRENVHLNGAMLGMRRAEIRAKFDEIVAFSGIEEFIDTPVKHYSSGMYMRLAFSVAAHLEPEILLIDEVLAVGDQAFQQKCLRRMGEVSREGRTVLFVSHNMDAIRRLCQRTVWLEHGRVRAIDQTARCVSEYLLQSVRVGGRTTFDPPHQMASGMPMVLHAVQLTDEGGRVTSYFSASAPIHVRIEWESRAPLYKPRIGFVVQTVDGVDVLTALDATSWSAGWLAAGRRVSNCVIPGGLLNEGAYIIDVGGDSPNRYDFTASRTGAILRFDVEDDMTLPNKYYGQEGFRDARWPGVLLLDLPWTQHMLQAAEATGTVAP